MRALIVAGCVVLSLSTVVEAQDAEWGAEGEVGTGGEVVGEADFDLLLPPVPVLYTARPLTLPALTLRGDLGFMVVHFPTGPGFTDFFTQLGGGFGIGLLDDLEVGLGGSPVAPTLLGVDATSGLRGLGGVLSPSGARGFIQPEFYARYRFFHSDMVEVGAELGLSIPTDDTDFGLSVGVPARIRFGEQFALDLALVFLTSFAEDSVGDLDPFFAMALNVAPRFATGMFYVGIDTGFSVPLEDAEFTIIPFGAEAGATFGVAESLVLDVFAHGGMPAFLVPGSDGDKVLSELWVIGVGARAHIGLAR